jgi:hypothetical protein
LLTTNIAVGDWVVLIYSTEIYFLGYYCIRPISTQKNFPQKKTFVKCDCPTQIFRGKKILKLKMFNF